MRPDNTRDGECARFREEVSAWLDGQSTEPRRLEAHLKSCSECARYARELQGLAKALNALPAPRVDDAFALRVVERVCRRNVPLRWAASGLAAAAAAVIVAAAVVLSLREPDQSPVRIAGLGDIEPGPAGDMPLDGEPAPLDYGFPVPPEVLDAGSDDLVLALADSGWFQEAAEAWEAETDLDELVATLDEAERVEFERLLRTYDISRAYEEGAEI